MAIKTLYLTNSLVDNWAELSETSPGAAALSSPVTGWIVGKIASGNYASFDANTERTTGGFTTTVQPDGSLDTTLYDSWRAGPYSGNFANTAWTIQAQLQSTTAVTATNAINLRFRVFRSTNIDGSGATEITGAAITVPASTFYSLTTTGSAVTNSNTWSPGALALDSEYLFFQVACYINAASGSNSSDVNFRVGTGATLVTTPDFTATNRNVTFTGVSTSATVGTVASSMTTARTLTGVSASATQGTIAVLSTAAVTFTGNSATSTIGSVTRSMTTARTLTGISATTTIHSFAGAAPYAAATLSGVSNTYSTVGTLTRSITVNRTPTGVTSTSTIGNLTTTMQVGRSLTGVTSTSSTVGSITRSSSVGRTLTGVSSSPSVGSITGTGAKIVSITGISRTASVGSLGWSKGVTLIGLVAEAFLGTYTAANIKTASLTGVTSSFTLRPFTNVYPSIPLTSVKAKVRVGSFKYYRPSPNVFEIDRLRQEFTNSYTRKVYDIPAYKLTTFIAKDKRYNLEQDRNIHFVTGRLGALTYS
jgi:hypothetical protein